VKRTPTPVLWLITVGLIGVSVAAGASYSLGFGLSVGGIFLAAALALEVQARRARRRD
jgi:hypothetical protein